MDLRPNNDGLPLAQVAAALGDRASGTGAVAADVTVRGITVDSRKVLPGDLFAALPGAHVHGARFTQQARAAGAVAVLTDPAGAAIVGDDGPALLIVDDPRSLVGVAAAEIYGHPSADLLLFGVTGTNGKTTTTWLLESGLRSAGHITGMVGTVETQIAGQPVPSVRTTPEAAELHALLAVMRERGVTAVAIEVSSHALSLGRVDGCVFDVVGFTQLGTDHLDFHRTAEDYFDAKTRLFTPEHGRRGVICVDSDGGRRMVAESRIPTTSLATNGQPADWSVSDVVRATAGGYSFLLRGPAGEHIPAGVSLPGRFNVANASLAIAMLHTAGVSDDMATRGVLSCPGVPGRMEQIDIGQDFLALVDYAHTPDALTAVLTSLRRDAGGKIVVVMGSGGDRDPSKRTVMGEVTARLADVVIVTDDNPRLESPEKIRAAILSGAKRVAEDERALIEEVPGRASAIARAVTLAEPGDFVIVAGKGHEQGQEIDGHVDAFDDRAVLLEALRRRLDSGGGVGGSSPNPEDHRRPEEER